MPQMSVNYFFDQVHDEKSEMKEIANLIPRTGDSSTIKCTLGIVFIVK
jgi:hypothetical protein